MDEIEERLDCLEIVLHAFAASLLAQLAPDDTAEGRAFRRKLGAAMEGVAHRSLAHGLGLRADDTHVRAVGARTDAALAGLLISDPPEGPLRRL